MKSGATMAFRPVVLLTLFAGAVIAEEVTPIEKVIQLIEGIRDEVAKDGTTEAAAYNDFACFCKKTTEDKSDSVKKGNNKIDRLSANIAEKTQTKIDSEDELHTREKEQQKNKLDLQSTESR